uniref:Ribosome-releasing factor 2, mitochondrial n=2 Tax=Talaromyces stipitatus (strain ATCC 10500 / CBS 375.48 / QM 6759 / NRRL 1006) TaxID=441959 RepID=RRF2M_TALSN|nr:RecName: Full=Ribosome-releasing factor 2, mitochondrial; Short=RRF2mt; AltName: Full=Elongation factor G 2, mitochondrial; Short=EF-G2mt; Short=mEF-G 2 [Talaromyces stipitatus ATCC 10500]
MVSAPLLGWAAIRPIPVSRLKTCKYASNSLQSYNGIVASYLRLHYYRSLSSSAVLAEAIVHLEKTRNIGIIAHIDAGKTTTTERMLYYSGFTRRIGDVDDGSTVTDFLPAERARGITIQSAAITFHWPPLTGDGTSSSPSLEDLEAQNLPRSRASHTVNLIDTPGHADFTFEVLRSLRILDGAVCILDGVAGVEAQTEKVWHQASVYQIPRIVYVNKLDRDGAAFGRTVREVGSRLQGWPAVCQIPWFEGSNGRFTGIADVVSLQGLLWKEGGDGKSVKVFDLNGLENEDKSLAEELKRARVALVELLSEHDEDMVESFFEHEEDHLTVPSITILKSLRKCLLGPETQKIIPVFAGSSFRNMGVQPLLDAVNNLLPGPSESHDPEISLGSDKTSLGNLLSGELALQQDPKTASIEKSKQKKKAVVTRTSVDIKSLTANLESCALAFKVVSDAKRGVLVYVRVYSGSLNRNCHLYNTNLHVTERAPRLFKMYANDAVEVDSIPAGHIGVVVGLKYARTGDTLISCTGSKSVPPEPLNTLQLRPIDVPPPVFFASIEPHSLSEEKNMQEALALLLREDPSLHVTIDEDSGQTLLSGMGELHLEIARDRLVNDFKAKASMGRIEIGYRECVLDQSNPVTKIFDREVAGRKGKAGCTAVVEPYGQELESDGNDTSGSDDIIFTETVDGNKIIISAPGVNITTDKKGKEESTSLPPQLDLNSFRTSLYNGALSALARGPQFAFPMHNTKVTLTCNAAEHLFGSESSASALSAAARLATQGALRNLTTTAASTGTGMMEPVMNVIISVDEASLGAVVHDISSARGGHIVSLDEEMPISTSLSQSPESQDQPVAVDINKIYAPPDPFETPSVAGGLPIQAPANQPRTITAKVPLKEMVGYLKHLRSLSAGRGTFVMHVDRFERMSAQRQKAVLAELNR